MSTALEPSHASSMGREQYRAIPRSRAVSTGYISDVQDRNQWEHCFSKLSKIRSYEFDWNDEEAEPLSQEVVSLAVAVAKTLRANHEPAPSGCIATDEGHVIFIWEDGVEYIEVEIDRYLFCTIRRIRPGSKRAESAEFRPFSRVY